MSITALAVIEKEIRGTDVTAKISNSLGKPVTDPSVMKFINGALMYITASAGSKSDITNCSKQSIIDCLISAATVRLPVDNRKLAYLIPYGNTCTFMPDYKGYVYKIKEADPSADVTVGIVYKGDTFGFSREDGKVNYKHVVANPFEDNPANITGVYCFIKTDSGSYIEVMSKRELDKIRAASKMKSGYIWQTWELEMYKKSVIRRACKVKFTEAIAELDALDNKLFNAPIKENPQIAPAKPMPDTPIAEAEIVKDDVDLAAKAEEAKKRIAEQEATEATKNEQEPPKDEPKASDSGLAPEPDKIVLKGLIAAREQMGRGPAKYYVEGQWAQTFDKDMQSVMDEHKAKEEDVELTCHLEKSKSAKTGQVYENLVIDEIAKIEN